MAGKTSTTTTPTTTDAPAADTNGQTPTAKPTFDWAELAAPMAAPSKTATVDRKVDAIAETPEPIRQRVEVSLMKTVARIKAKANSSAKRVRVEPYWTVQPLASEAQGEAFIKAATRYAKYRPTTGDIPHRDTDAPMGQITVRFGKVGHYTKSETGEATPAEATADGAFLGVRYSARAFEGRGDSTRVPGTAK